MISQAGGQRSQIRIREQAGTNRPVTGLARPVEDAYWSGGARPHPECLGGGACPASGVARLGRPDPTRRRPGHTTSGTPTGSRSFGVSVRPGSTARARAVTDRASPAGSMLTRLRTVTTASVAPHEHASSSAPFAVATAPAPPGPGPACAGVSAAKAARSAAVCARARATTSSPTSSAITPANSTNTLSARAISVAEPACRRLGRLRGRPPPRRAGGAAVLIALRELAEVLARPPPPLPLGR